MASEILSLVNRLEVASDNLSEEEWSKQDPAVRRKACDVLRKTGIDLEETGDLIDRFLYSPLDNVLVRLALDLGIFKILVEKNSPLDVKALAKEVGKADETLLRRILRALSAMNAIGEAGKDEYVATHFTRAMTTPKGISGVTFSFEFGAPAWNQIPYFLAENGYRNPMDPSNTPLQKAFNSEKHFFDLMKERGILPSFDTFMTVQKQGRPNFADFFPVNTQLVDGFHGTEDAVMLVDVGGGRGQEILELRQKVPNLPGRMILQETPELVGSLPETAGMEIMEHDFFKPQPIRGARAYYFRTIFHDWSDEICVRILEQLVPAMEPAYSKILINDLVVTDHKEGVFMTRSDMNMMALLGSMERSEVQWRELLGRVGLEIVKIWNKEARSESILEVMVKKR